MLSQPVKTSTINHFHTRFLHLRERLMERAESEYSIDLVIVFLQQ